MANLSSASTCDPKIKEEEEEGKERDDDDKSYDPDDDDDRGDDDDDDGDTTRRGRKRPRTRGTGTSLGGRKTGKLMGLGNNRKKADEILADVVAAEIARWGPLLVNGGDDDDDDDDGKKKKAAPKVGLTSYDLAHHPQDLRDVPIIDITSTTTPKEVQAFLSGVAAKKGYNALFIPSLLTATTAFSSTAAVDAEIGRMKARLQNQEIFRDVPFSSLVIPWTRGTEHSHDPSSARIVNVMNEPVWPVLGAPSSPASGVSLPEGMDIFGLDKVAPTIFSFACALRCFSSELQSKFGFAETSPAPVSFPRRSFLGPIAASRDSAGTPTDYSFSAAQSLQLYMGGGATVFLLGSKAASHLVGEAAEDRSDSSFVVAFRTVIDGITILRYPLLTLMARRSH